MTSLPRWFGKKKKKVLSSSDQTTIIASSLNPADPYTSMLFLDLLQFNPGVYRIYIFAKYYGCGGMARLLGWKDEN